MMKLRTVWLALALSPVWVPSTFSAPADEPDAPGEKELPRELKLLVERVLDVSRSYDDYSARLAGSSPATPEDFWEPLKKCGKAADLDLVGSLEKKSVLSLKEEVVLMAFEYAKSAERVDELLAVYTKNVSQRPTMFRSPALARKHAAPSYRLAWETTLLCPRAPVVSTPALQALSRIGADDTIPVLVFCATEKNARFWESYTKTYAPKHRSTSAMSRRWCAPPKMIGSIHTFYSQRAVEAQLEILRFSEEAGFAKRGNNAHFVRGIVLSALTSEIDQQWKKYEQLLKEFDPGGLTPLQQELLGKARARHQILSSGGTFVNLPAEKKKTEIWEN